MIIIRDFTDILTLSLFAFLVGAFLLFVLFAYMAIRS